jgi:hypothetical protein
VRSDALDDLLEPVEREIQLFGERFAGDVGSPTRVASARDS